MRASIWVLSNSLTSSASKISSAWLVLTTASTCAFVANWAAWSGLGAVSKMESTALATCSGEASGAPRTSSGVSGTVSGVALARGAVDATGGIVVAGARVVGI